VLQIRDSLYPNPDPGFFDDSGSEFREDFFDIKFETFAVKNKFKLFSQQELQSIFFRQTSSTRREMES
jgi:hypothetical protein